MSEEKSTGTRRVELQGSVRVARGRLFDVQSVIEDAKQERASLDGFLGTLRGLFGGKEAAIANADGVLSAAEAAKVKIAAQVAALEAELAEFDARIEAEETAREAREASRRAAAEKIEAAGGPNAEALALLDAQVEVMQSVVLSDGAMEATRAVSRLAADVAYRIQIGVKPMGMGKSVARRTQHEKVEFNQVLRNYREALAQVSAMLLNTAQAVAMAELATLDFPESYTFLEESRQIGGPWELLTEHHRFVQESEQLVAIGEKLGAERRIKAEQLAAVVAEREELLDGVGEATG